MPPHLVMIEAFWYGLGTGMVLSVMLGTVFFLLIQNSIDNGARSSIFIISGVITSDFLMIVASHFNAQLIPQGGTTEMIVRTVGAMFLIIYGILNITGKKNALYPESPKSKIGVLFSMGFLLNIMNPGNFIAWLAISSQIALVFNYTIHQAILFYIGALSAILIMELIISYLAAKLKKLFTSRLLAGISKVVGVLFIGFAIFLLIPVLKHLF